MNSRFSITACVVGVICSLGVTAALAEAADTPPSLQLPALTGPYQVGKTSYDFADPSRPEIYTADPTDKRELMVYVWYPSNAVPGAKPAPYLENAVVQALTSNAGLSPDDFVNLVYSIQTHAISGAAVSTAQCRYPILIFSPGFGVLPEVYTSQAEELASHGYIIASISHTYDSLVTEFPDGRIALQSSLLGSDNQQVLKQDVDIRAADARFVLNQLEHLNANDPQGLFTGHLELNRVGIFGHSLGGTTVVNAMLLDRRFKAGLAMDGSSQLYNTLFGNRVKNSLNRPFMLINSEQFSTLSSIGPATESFYENRLKNDAYNLTIKGTAHGNFEDGPLLIQPLSAYSQKLADQLKDAFDAIGPIEGKRGAQIIDDYTLAFFDKYFKNQNLSLLNSPDPDYPEVQFSSRHVTNFVLPQPPAAPAF